MYRYFNLNTYTMKINNLLSTIAILSIVFFSGCAKDDFVTTFGECPIVIATSPVDGAFSVPLAQTITANFNKEMNAETINTTSFVVTADGNPIVGTVSYTGVVASFDPTSSLLANTIYTATITTLVKDEAGNALQTNYVWMFTTGISPFVMATSPINEAVNVALNELVTATFNKSMNPSTINSNSFIVTQAGTIVPGVVTYSGVIATFTPTNPLTATTVYTATITTIAEDVAGNPVLVDYSWTFTTDIPPFVIANVPLKNAINVALNNNISVTFSESMKSSSINTSSFIVTQAGLSVSGSIIYANDVATFTPSMPLKSATIYTVTITNKVEDSSGNSMLVDYFWTFTTDTAPTVTSTSPIDNATSVALNKTITATFSTPMNVTTLTSNSYVVRQGNTSITGSLSYANNTVSFVPNVPLLGNKVYTCTITTAVKNTFGTNMKNDYTWEFTTIVPVVVPPPPVATTGLFFGVFGGNAGITNQGLFTVVNGNLGTTAASSLITGFTDGTSSDVYTVTPLNNGLVTSEIYAAAPAPGSASKATIALAGLNAARAAYLSISPASMPGGIDPGAGELGGLTLPPGIYKSNGGTFNITNGNLTLDAQGNPNAIFVFQCASALTVGDAAPSSVVLINGALAKNIYWYVGSAAVINYAGGGVMNGNILANSGVTLSSPANSTNSSVTTLNGRAISLVASVTMVNTVINVPN